MHAVLGLERDARGEAGLGDELEHVLDAEAAERPGE